MAASGFTPISLYYSATASAVPLAANLTAGELALNTNDGKLYYKNSSNVVTLLASSASTVAAGSTTQVQYNLSGVLAGSANMTFNGTVLTSSFAGPVAATTLSASSTVSGTGFSTYLASPPAIGSTAPAAGSFTTLSASSTVSGTGFSTYLASPPAIGGTAAAAGAFTTLSASSTVSGTGFSTYLASPPAIGGTAAAAGSFTALSYNTTLTGGTGVVNLGSGQFYKSASGNVGIGTVSPTTALNVYKATAAVVSVDGDSSAVLRATRYTTDTNPSEIVARKARGTLAAPTTVATSDIAGGVFFQAYGGTNFRNIGRIDGLVQTYTSDTNIAGALAFYTNNSSTDVTERMRLTSGGALMINNTGTPVYNELLNVTGADARINGLTVGLGYSNNAYSTVVGDGALAAVATGQGNTAFGYQALANTTGTGGYNTAVGPQAGLNLTGNYNTVVGYGAGSGTSSSASSTFIGVNSGSAASCSYTVILGSYTGSGLPLSGGVNNYVVLSDGSGNVKMTYNATGVGFYVQSTVTTKSAAATLTGAEVLTQILSTTGTSYTVTMPTGTAMDTATGGMAVDSAFDFTVINAASGTITMATNTNFNNVGSLSVPTGTSASYKIRKTAANTFVMYRM